MKRFFTLVTHKATNDTFGFGRNVESVEEYNQLLGAELKTRGWNWSDVLTDFREQSL